MVKVRVFDKTKLEDYIRYYFKEMFRKEIPFRYATDKLLDLVVEIANEIYREED